MRNNKMSRKDKIEFLKRLEQGAGSISELPPKSWETFEFKDGCYTNENLKLDDLQFESYINNNPLVGIILMQLGEDKAPITLRRKFHVVDFSID